jgi:hypothetical protein
MGVENLSLWEVEDTEGCLAISERRVAWIRADRTRVRYISKDLGVVGDFRHVFDAVISEAFTESAEHRGLIRLWELRNDWDSRTWIYARQKVERPDMWTVHLEQRSGGDDLWAFHGSHLLEMGVRYRLEVSRSGGLCAIRVYSDPSNGEPLEDSGGIEGADTRYRHLWLSSTIMSRRNTGNWSTGYIENLVI